MVAASDIIYPDGTTLQDLLDTVSSGPGIDGVTFTINQDNTGSDVSMEIKFDRGSNYSRLVWDHTNARFQLESVSGVTIADLVVKDLVATGKLDVTSNIELDGQLNLDGATGTVMIKKNSGTGDLEFKVGSSDYFVFDSS